MDNLTADFLDPILAEVQAELMMGIWQHIRPPPYPHGGPDALRILGKLGGRNRRFLKHAIFPKALQVGGASLHPTVYQLHPPHLSPN